MRAKTALLAAVLAALLLVNRVFDAVLLEVHFAAALAGVGKTLWLRRKGAGAP